MYHGGGESGRGCDNIEGSNAAEEVREGWDTMYCVIQNDQIQSEKVERTFIIIFSVLWSRKTF